MPAYIGILGNGDLLWSTVTPITVAASPLLSPFIRVDGFTQVVPQFAFAGGTSVHTIEFSIDGTTADANLATVTPTSLTAFTLAALYFRWKTVQTVADATVSKVFLRARA